MTDTQTQNSFDEMMEEAREKGAAAQAARRKPSGPRAPSVTDLVRTDLEANPDSTWPQVAQRVLVLMDVPLPTDFTDDDFENFAKACARVRNAYMRASSISKKGQASA